MQAINAQSYKRIRHSIRPNKMAAMSNKVFQVFLIHRNQQKDGERDKEAQIDQTKTDPPVMAGAGKLVRTMMVTITAVTMASSSVDNLWQLMKE